MSVSQRRTGVTGVLRMGSAVLAVFGLGVSLVGCAASGSVGATESPSTRVTVALKIQQTGPVGTSPSQASQAVSAAECRAFSPREKVPGGLTYLVHLLVDRVDLPSTLATLRKLDDVFDVQVEDEASFSSTPADPVDDGVITC